MYKRPKKLIVGDTVAVISPSFPTANWYKKRFQFGLNNLTNKLGLKIRLAEHAEKAKGFLSESPPIIAEEINAIVKDQEIKAIFTTIGGFNSSEILPYLDTQALIENPKILIGYSDTTSLLLGVNSLAKWVTFYGPAIMTQFGEYPKPLEYTIESIKKTLFENEIIGPVKDSNLWTNEFVDWGGDDWNKRQRVMKINDGKEVWRKGKGEGYLYGGNIETLNFLIGTDFFTPPEKVIFFWEATEEEAFLPRIRRSLVQLKQIGFFQKVDAMLIGKSPDCKTFREVSLKDVVLEVLSEYSFPIIYNLSFGHTDPMMTIPIGILASINTEDKENVVSINSNAVV